ncbi:hypothetical protein J2Z35_001251 [Acetoanaerobium pronyense]|uniref:Uncharacterized protein n=1 Tax=Acetoanaerobium pronyense TaxID=1482736 RepID=A0ABS4KI66_9FIRM|nr:hypothetical protein [Acetoanaerobium pronyense]MBP2027457.1 hypothetical protein [Acetoanaerobium pronyense]
MDITIHLLDESVKEELFEFEVENRNYFAQIGFPRDESYYDFRNFEQITKDLIFDQENGMTVYPLRKYWTRIKKVEPSSTFLSSLIS